MLTTGIIILPFCHVNRNRVAPLEIVPKSTIVTSDKYVPKCLLSKS